MSNRMFGLESEYAFAALGSDGMSLDRGQSVGLLVESAKRDLAHLPDMHGGRIFLQNGSCLYIDCGLHPELTTPECTTPWEAVRYVKAGERVLTSLAQALERRAGPVSKAMFFRCNVDYSGTRTTWGCHESYLHKADRAALCEQILPHLVSRIIYTGAGGFDNCFPGVRFLISPRVPHLLSPVSDSSTSSRGIFHTKDEPLCGNGYHRLHVLAGESVCSQTSAFLKVGATALIVALIEAGLCPGDSVKLRCPVTAMRQFAADTECKAAAELVAGDPATALEIQSHYLETAEANLDQDFIPTWAPQVCAEWRAMLERLQGAPDSVATTLDWAIKLSLYKAHVARRGIEWEALTVPLRAAANSRRARALEAGAMAALLGLAVDVEASEPEPNAEPSIPGPSPSDDHRLWAIAEELFAIDTRFGQLGEQGVFEAMDGAGVLTHQLAGIDNIEAAVTEPPAMGRARIRGECVKRLHSGGGRYNCDWGHILDMLTGQALDLADPWCVSEQWVTSGERRAPVRSPGFSPGMVWGLRGSGRRPPRRPDQNGA